MATANPEWPGPRDAEIGTTYDRRINGETVAFSVTDLATADDGRVVVRGTWQWS